MKLIHLNVESFKYFDALVDFLAVEKPDMMSLVEAIDGTFFGSQGELNKEIISQSFIKNLAVADGQVREVVVSDHLPLVLDFSL